METVVLQFELNLFRSRVVDQLFFDKNSKKVEDFKGLIECQSDFFSFPVRRFAGLGTRNVFSTDSLSSFDILGQVQLLS